jgi:hypothetical protein
LTCVQKNEKDFSKSPWFIRGKDEFKDSNWELEVDRFHLNNDALKTDLIELANSIQS